MKCYCYETETDLVFCVDNVEPQYEKNVEAAWFKKTDGGYRKIYSRDMGRNGVSDSDRKLVSENFTRLGESMLRGNFAWERALKKLIDKLEANKIKYYVIGSCSEGILGVKIDPHDIDIMVHTDDFFSVKEILSDYVVEPFLDNLGTWVVRYFGRVCIEGAMIDIAADEKMNGENHAYDQVQWNGYHLHIEPLKVRYETELQREREDRIKAMEVFMNMKD